MPVITCATSGWSNVFVQAPPRVVWAALHDPAASSSLFPELRLGPAVPSWPAAAATRSARTRLGLLREWARVESLEARPESVFRLRVTGSGFESEWWWRLEPIAGGTRVIHAATFDPIDRWTDILVRLGRRSLEARVERICARSRNAPSERADDAGGLIAAVRPRPSVAALPLPRAPAAPDIPVHGTSCVRCRIRWWRPRTCPARRRLLVPDAV